MTELAGDWARLSELTERTDPPNLIVAGGAGTGKSAALRFMLAGQITMWLRCSGDMSLRDSRDRIKGAARRRVDEGSIAWIVLEHADMLHTDAQAFLRRVIETSLGGTRFALEVRDLAAIAEPLVSRCVLYHVPHLLPYEIRAEIQRQVPACSMDAATRLAEQSHGNLRWAICQARGGGTGFLADGLKAPAEIHSWSELLAAMEALQRTGSAPRAWLDSVDPIWERPGGVDPWAILAATIARQIH